MNELTCNEIAKIGASMALIGLIQSDPNMSVKHIKDVISLIQLTNEDSDNIEEKLQVMFKEAKEKGL